MARYLFDVQTGSGTTRDEEGNELDGPEAAHHEAMNVLAELAQNGLSWREGLIAQINVKDSSHKPVLRAVLSISVERYHDATPSTEWLL